MELGVIKTTKENIAKAVLMEFEFDPDEYDILSDVVIARLIRRTASFQCPCTYRKLIVSVKGIFEEMIPGDVDIHKIIEEVLDNLIMYGDLMEGPDLDPEYQEMGEKRLVYIMPPCFVKTNSRIFMVGIKEDDAPVVPEIVVENVLLIKHLRYIIPEDAESVTKILKNDEFIELSVDGWLKTPKRFEAKELIANYNSILDRQTASGDVPGLHILDPKMDAKYYKGRWKKAEKQTGNYVGRRPQEYGNDLWCYIELCGGQPKKFLDLPVQIPEWRACDEAWYLQAAIDHDLGVPQVYRLSGNDYEGYTIKFFSPLPGWVRRRLDVIGDEIPPGKCLLSYALDATQVEGVTEYLKSNIWMSNDMDKKG